MIIESPYPAPWRPGQTINSAFSSAPGSFLFFTFFFFVVVAILFATPKGPLDELCDSMVKP